MRPVLVLGATGFLGSHVTEALARSENAPEWVGVARYPPPRRDSAGVYRSVDLVASTAEDYERLLADVRPSAVINCAGVTTGNQASLQANNIGIVRKLVSAMTRHGEASLVQFGSAAEYGPQPNNDPVAESTVAQPSSPYGITKLEGTRVATAAMEDERVQGTVLRVFNPVGARAPESSLAGRAARAMRLAMTTRQPSITLGSLEAQRDFVAADDVGTAAALAVQATNLPSLLNVGRGVATSSAALITLLEDVAGFDGELLESDPGSPRSSWVPRQRADITLLRTSLGWVPSTPLARAVAALWESTAVGVCS